MSTKQADLGINTMVLTAYRWPLVSYLPTMYHRQNLIASVRPTEIASLDTLWYPMDGYIWTLVALCVAAQVALLVVMDKIYIKTKGRQGARRNYVFQSEFIS